MGNFLIEMPGYAEFMYVARQIASRNPAKPINAINFKVKLISKIKTKAVECVTV